MMGAMTLIRVCLVLAILAAGAAPGECGWRPFHKKTAGGKLKTREKKISKAAKKSAIRNRKRHV
jgi:hypothetical protein